MAPRTDKILSLTAIIEYEIGGYVATCPELDIVSQGQTIEEARMNLLEAVEGFFEIAAPSEIQRRLKHRLYVMPIMPTVARSLSQLNVAMEQVYA